MQSITNGKLDYVASFRIYVTPSGELIVLAGNCRVGVDKDRAREFLDSLILTAERFKTHEPSHNGHLVMQ